MKSKFARAARPLEETSGQGSTSESVMSFRVAYPGAFVSEELTETINPAAVAGRQMDFERTAPDLQPVGGRLAKYGLLVKLGRGASDSVILADDLKVDGEVTIRVTRRLKRGLKFTSESSISFCRNVEFDENTHNGLEEVMSRKAAHDILSEPCMLISSLLCCVRQR